ncbi:MAG TPA: GNAT family N-acetyltransferase [Thermoanaerobaculia bacterium]|nr:GNAT family N-acetyltransferase [Thermoanaerobaculia bacterium]
MRGLRLFVRPIEGSNRDDLRAFLDRNGVEDRQSCLSSDGQDCLSSTVPACGLLGKLLGDIVAVVSMEITGDAVRVDEILVARELRRKWIGRAMMREVEQLAMKMDRRRVVVDDARDAHEFLRRVGFEVEGERWVRVVS